jgi:hypothetical protein
VLRDENLFGLGEAQEAREVILHLSQGHLAESGCPQPGADTVAGSSPVDA